MKYVNWLVSKIFYKHKIKLIGETLRIGTDDLIYNVEYENQIHANLCSAASVCMIERFFGKPFFSLEKNPYGIFEPYPISKVDYEKHNEYKKYDSDLKDTIKNQLKESLREHGPLILTLSMRFSCEHSVVLVGMVGEDLIYHDPLTKSDLKISLGDYIENRSVKIKGEKKCHVEFFTKNQDVNITKDICNSKKQTETYTKQKLQKKHDLMEFLPLSKNLELDKNMINSSIIQVLSIYARRSLLNHLWKKHDKDKEKVRDFLKNHAEKKTSDLTNPMDFIQQLRQDHSDPTLTKIIRSIDHFTNSREKPANNDLDKRSSNQF